VPQVAPAGWQLSVSGGKEACTELRALRATAMPDETELLQEIETAQQMAGCGVSAGREGDGAG